MEEILDMMEQELKQTFATCGYEEKFAKIVLSNRPDLYEYQCNRAIAAAKAYKKKPIDVASVMVERLAGEGGHLVFKEVVAVTPGFINLELSKQLPSGYVNGVAAGNKLGLEVPKRPETVVMDYGGVNVTKPFHVGRLRATIIGESIKRIGRFLGYKMIDDIHLGDWGLQMRLIIEELRDRKPELMYFDRTYVGEFPSQAPFTISELEEIYLTASAKSKEDKTFKERTHEVTLKLQKGYPSYKAIWQYIMTVSVEGLKENHFDLNVEFDPQKGGSDAEPYIGDMTQTFINKGLAYEGQGVLAVDVAGKNDSRGIPSCPARKSSGASLYATSDLATIVEWEQDFHPGRYTCVVDKRQGVHFEQVLKVVRKAGIIVQDTPMIFPEFGTMNGKDGKLFRTREGRVMRLEELIDEIDGAVYARTMENRTVSREEAGTTSRIAGLAALKYGNLSNQAGKDHVLDTERLTSSEGNTGSYILYTTVRVGFILSKYRDNDGSTSEQALEKHVLPPHGEPEKALTLMLFKHNEVLENSFVETVPHKICQHIYELASAFNSSHHDTKILSEEDEARKNNYTGLITLTKWVLETCIGLLGIEASDRVWMTTEREHQPNEGYRDERQ